jgi:DNA-binding GntR family transcriptional regulator
VVEEFSDEEFERMRKWLTEMDHKRDRHRDFQHAHAYFHLVTVEKHYGEVIGETILRLHQRVYWHQRVYMSRPRVPEDFISLDQKLFDALSRRDRATARALLEFHLIDQAIGLVLDVDPDHTFGPLLRAARGSGLEIKAHEDGRIERPAPLMITRPGVQLQQLETTNLRHSV